MDRHIKELSIFLKNNFKGSYRLNEPLNRHTTFKIGGPAALWIKPKDEQELQILIKFVNKYKIPFLVLGAGSNILINDRGFFGVVINLNGDNQPDILKEYAGGSVVIKVSAGSSLRQVLNFCLKNNLSGFEFSCGIPGTVGGALIMNAGVYSKENKGFQAFSDITESVRVMDKRGNIFTLDKKQIKFQYRKSNLSKYIILSASFRFYHSNKNNIKAKCQNLLEYRYKQQENKYPSAGCVFKNLFNNGSGRLRELADANGIVSAGKIIDLCGLKGRRIGDAQVSNSHANFIVNVGNAYARDVTKLMKLINKNVKEKYGISLKPEIKVI